VAKGPALRNVSHQLRGLPCERHSQKKNQIGLLKKKKYLSTLYQGTLAREVSSISSPRVEGPKTVGAQLKWRRVSESDAEVKEKKMVPSATSLRERSEGMSQVKVQSAKNKSDMDTLWERLQNFEWEKHRGVVEGGPERDT